MTLYEIDQEILNCVDEETGEIIDLDKLQALRIAKDRKIESIGLWYKNLNSDVQALELEIKMLTERKKKAQSKMEQLKAILCHVLNYTKFETPKVSITYRKSSAVETTDSFVEWAKQNRQDLLTYKEPEASKTAIKKAILNNEVVLFAAITEHNNIHIK